MGTSVLPSISPPSWCSKTFLIQRNLSSKAELGRLLGEGTETCPIHHMNVEAQRPAPSPPEPGGTEICSITPWTWRRRDLFHHPLNLEAHLTQQVPSGSCTPRCVTWWHWPNVVTQRPTSTSIPSRRRFSARPCIMHGSIPASFKCITCSCEKWLGCGSWLQFLKAALIMAWMKQIPSRDQLLSRSPELYHDLPLTWSCCTCRMGR